MFSSFFPQEKHEQLVKQSKEEEEIQRQREKQREIEQKAQEKYKHWLQKKNQEKIETEKKEKVIYLSCSAFSERLFKLFVINYKILFYLTGGSRSEGGAGEGTPQEGRREV